MVKKKLLKSLTRQVNSTVAPLAASRASGRRTKTGGRRGLRDAADAAEGADGAVGVTVSVAKASTLLSLLTERQV